MGVNLSLGVGGGYEDGFYFSGNAGFEVDLLKLDIITFGLEAKLSGLTTPAPAVREKNYIQQEDNSIGFGLLFTSSANISFYLGDLRNTQVRALIAPVVGSISGIEKDSDKINNQLITGLKMGATLSPPRNNMSLQPTIEILSTPWGRAEDQFLLVIGSLNFIRHF